MTLSSLERTTHFAKVQKQSTVCSKNSNSNDSPALCEWSLELAAMMHELEETKADLETDSTKLETLFNEMIQMCLW